VVAILELTRTTVLRAALLRPAFLRTTLLRAAFPALMMRALSATLEVRLRSDAIGDRSRLLLRKGLRRRLWHPLLGRCEPIRDAPEVIVVIAVVRLRLRRRPHIALLGLLLGLLSGCDQAEVVLCMLQITFGHDGIARRVGVTRELEILLGDVVRCAANLYVWAIRFVGPAERIWAFAVVATAHALVLTWSHLRSLDGARRRKTVEPDRSSRDVCRLTAQPTDGDAPGAPAYVNPTPQPKLWHSSPRPFWR
jgi:hypothetical protein